MSTFCVLPWIHLATHPDGKATLCCVSDHTMNASAARNFKDGKIIHLNLNSNNVDEMLNSDYFRQTRLEMLDGKEPAACSRCYREEEKGFQSKRIEEGNKFSLDIEEARAITTSTGSIPVDLKFIELRLGNICNIRCRTCNPHSSTKWVSEYSKLQDNLKFVTVYDYKINSSWTENDSFWDNLLDHSKNVEVIYVNGGEPTIVEKHWLYLEKLIQRGYNKNITLWYNINMTNLPDKLVELWSHFKKVQVFASIDDIGERNDYIRTGSKWEDVIKNLDKLQQLSWIETSICQTVSWMNIFYLNEFYDFANSRNLVAHLNLVYDPKFLDPRVLPDELKQVVLEKIKDIDSGRFLFLKNHLETESDNKLFVQGMKFNDWLDESRNQNFALSFPEWYKYMKGYR